MSTDRDDVRNYLARLERESAALAEIRAALNVHREAKWPGELGPGMSESDLEVIARLAATVDRYDEGVEDALRAARVTASRASRDSICMEHTVDPLEAPGVYVHRAVSNLTPADVAKHVASRVRKAAKAGEPVFVSSQTRPWLSGFGSFVCFDDDPFPSLSYSNICDPGCYVRGCVHPHGHTDDHKLVYYADTRKRTIPPHAAITDTPGGRMATWYEPNRGAK